MPIRVVVAEDNYLVREAVVRLLDSSPEIEIVGACEDFDDLIATVEREHPDVVVTDIRMPPTGTDEGVRAAKQLRKDHPEIGVVVLSQYVEPGYALELLDTGSERRAYLLKERVSDVDQLLRAIQEVARGGSVIDPKVVEALVTARSRRADSRLEFLTPREQEVLAEMAQGRNNAAVASALGLSERAVEKHINSVFSKLGLSEEPDVNRRVKAVLLYLADRPPQRLAGPEDRVGEERDHRGERQRAGDGQQDAERLDGAAVGDGQVEAPVFFEVVVGVGRVVVDAHDTGRRPRRARAFSSTLVGRERGVVGASSLGVAEHPPRLVHRGHVVSRRSRSRGRGGCAGRARGRRP